MKPERRTPLGALFFGAVSLVLAGCSALKEPEPVLPPRPKLPLRVALLPLDHVRVEESPEGRHPDMTRTSMRLDIDPAALGEGLRQELAGRAFADVVSVPDLETAIEGRFDLVARAWLSYGPAIWTRKHEDYTFRDAMGHQRGANKTDRVYRMDGKLELRFYDPLLVPSLDAAEPVDGLGLVHAIPAWFGDVPTTLNERSGGSLLTLVSTIIVPPPYLELEGAELEELLEDLLPQQVTQAIGEAAAGDGERLFGDGRTVPFALVGAELTFDPERAGLLLSGSLRLDPAGRVRRMRHVRVRDASGELHEATLEREASAWRFEVPLPALEPGSLVRLELEAGSRALYRRGFTFRVPAPPEG